MKQFLMTAAALLVAASAWAHEGHEAEDTDFKTAVCAQCQMAVTSKNYAAQIGTAEDPLFFDDIGCLVQYERQGKIAAKDIHGRFVRSAADDNWLDVTKAVWVLSKEVRTPMGYGLHAFPEAKAAKAFVAKHPAAKILTWEQAQEAVPRSMGKM